ncbi:MAG: ribosome silencing factor [Nitrospirae bacterium]|nr:ribosome silencing factor [Nitrospirota bacterium]
MCATAAKDKKAEDIVILDVRKISSITDYFIICTAASNKQLKAVYENIDRVISQAGEGLHHVEGLESARWTLIDSYDVIIHIFNADTREYYSLERLWGDAPRLRFPK